MAQQERESHSGLHIIPDETVSLPDVRRFSGPKMQKPADDPEEEKREIIKPPFRGLFAARTVRISERRGGQYISVPRDQFGEVVREVERGGKGKILEFPLSSPEPRQD